MSRFVHFLTTHWFAALLLAAAVVLGLLLLIRRRRGAAPGLRVLAAGLALAGLGGLIPSAAWQLGIAAAAVAVLLILLLVLVLSGWWSERVGYLIAAALAFGGGGYLAAVLGVGLAVAGKRLVNVQFLYPAWLLLLLVIPLLVLVSYRSLAGLGPVRRWVALGLRCALVALLVLALAEPRLRHESESQTVIFVIDRSLSIPEEPVNNASGQTVDARWERIKKFVNDAVAERGPGHKDDKAGLIVFGRRPRLELPPSDSPRFNFQEVFGTIDGNYTDIAAALKLALASFPEQTGKRIVLLSDGNENLGSAEDQARFARENGVQIDVVPLASGHRTENEILVQSIEAPAQVEQGAQLPIRVLIRSFNPHLVVGTLTVKQISEGQAVDVPGSPKQNVALQQGLNSFTFKQPLTAEKRSYTYEAEFLPEFVADEKGQVLAKGLPGDRPQNNRATTHVVARGQRRILLVEPHAGDHQYLVDRLTASRAKFQVDTIEVEKLPPDKDKLAVLFSNYDCIVLANVAASDVSEGAIGDNPGASLTEAQQEMIRSNTHDQGCGLVMIGGPNGYGAGGWRGTPVEKALPVDCDIKSVEVGGRGGLVLIMHASEIAEGNRWQKIIAKLAINKLSSDDMVGVLHYAWAGQGGSGHQWHIPFQVVGENRGRLLALVESLNPGDMPDVDPAFTKAYNELTREEYGLTTRHVIFISDGDHWNASQALLAKMRAAKITCSTVCITSHGQLEEQKMAAVARATNGRFYSVKNPSALPAIYTRETRVVSQSLLYERRLQPREVFRAGPTEGLPDVLPPLYGFVRTTAKSSPLVEVPIVTPPITGQQFPVLAYWHYGLGKAAAFTSDARTTPGKKFWDRDWAQSSMYSKFWEQVIEWALRPVESKHLIMLPPEYKDGTVKVTIEAHDDRNKPIIDLSLRGGVTTPGTKPDANQQQELKFEETAPGRYEAEFKADEAGSYFVSAQAVRRVPIKDKNGKVHEAEEGFDSVRSGVTIPYSPEFSDLETNTGLLERLRSMTDGQTYKDDGAALAEVARTAEVYRPGLPRFYPLQPIWYWLIVAAGVLLFFDVAVRRIALEPMAVIAWAAPVWERLRGRRAAERQPEFFERLRSRKAQVGESLQRERAGRRFEGGDVPVTPPAGAPDVPQGPATASPPRPAAAGGIAPEQQAPEPADYASRLLKAKKRVWKERDKDKEDRP